MGPFLPGALLAPEQEAETAQENPPSLRSVSPVLPQAPSHKGPNPRLRRALQRLVSTGSKVVLVGVLAWGLLFNFSEVRGSSMEPGIHDRDRILVDHVSYLWGGVNRGDVVVLRYPLDPSLDYIKRVVGLPGDEILMTGGELWLNGERVDEPYLDGASIDPYSHLRITVDEDHYFVLGDNRLRSSDSREFGQVPHSNLRGKVRLRLWPLGRAGLVR